MLNDIFNIMLPEICIGCFIILLLVLSMLVSPRLYKYSRFISLIGIFLGIVSLSTVQIEPQYFAFNRSVMSDSYTILFKFVILACGFLIAILSRNLIKTIKRHAYNFCALLLSALFGAMNIVSANDFLTLFVSIEVLSFSTYFLILSAKGYRSKEAGFKYLITSAVSSGVFLFGVSYIYGITGSINFSDIYEFVTNNDVSMIYSISAVFIILGLCAKLAVFPFANWIIDVYKGTETSVLAFLSTVPKLAIFGIICRLMVFPLNSSFELPFILAIISLITALWANTYAVREKNVKVILACSASANASYALLAASLVSVYNLSTVIFYLICYAFMNIGAFAFLNIYGDKNSMNISDFKGLFHNHHGICASYFLIVLSLAGIPIMSGFIAKIYLFTAIASSGLIFIPFLVGLMLLTIIALYYYLKILVPIFEKCDKNYNIQNLKYVFSQNFVLFVSAIITLIIGIYPEILIEICRYAAYNI